MFENAAWAIAIAISPGTMKTSYSKPLIDLIRLPSERPKTRMKSAEETTGARIVCVHRRVTRRHSRRTSARIERAGSGAA